MRECKGERHDRAGETRNETHGGEQERKTRDKDAHKHTEWDTEDRDTRGT